MWQVFKGWLAPETTKRYAASIDVDVVLQSLKPDPRSSDVLVTEFTAGTRSVTLSIDADDLTQEECLLTSRKLLGAFEEMNKLALSAASRSLLSTYNENWREYSERQEDGSYVDMSDPELDGAEFEAKLQLSAVSVIGAMVMFSYSDNGLFHGHSVVVNSFDGLDFSDTSADLFG